MSNGEDHTNDLVLLDQWRRTLGIYLDQRWLQGGDAFVLPFVRNGIIEARAEIRKIKGSLQAAGVAYDDFPDDEEASAEPPFMALPPPHDFVARPAVFDALRAAVLDNEGHARPATVVLYGAGGYGKTTLVRVLCADPQVRAAFPGGILWATLGQTSGAGIRAIAEIVETLTGRRPGFAGAEAAAARLRETLADRVCLLVIDDVFDPADLELFLVGGAGCTRLVTTRVGGLARDATQIPVDAMGAAEALALLGAHLPDVPPVVQRLAARLGGWPLLLTLVNGALREQLSVGTPLDLAITFVEQGLAEQGVTAFDAPEVTTRDRRVDLTIEVSTRLLSPAEHERFQELAIFAEDTPVPVALVSQYWQARGGWSLFQSRQLCTRLARLSLLQTFDGMTFRLHDVVRDYLRHRRAADLATWHTTLLDLARPAGGRWSDLPDAASYLWNLLAYHLHAAGRLDELRSLLLDFDWIDARLSRRMVTALIADYASLPGDLDIRAVEGALCLAAHILEEDLSQAAGQLFGRLGDRAAPAIRELLDQAAARQHRRWLRPLLASLDAPEGPLLRTLAGHTSRVMAVAVTPDGRRVVSASHDSTLRVWDLDHIAPPQVIETGAGWAWSVVVALDGQRVLAGCDDQALHMWDLATGAHVATLACSCRLEQVALSPDGQLLIAGDPGAISVIRLADGAPVPGPAGGLPITVTPSGGLLYLDPEGQLALWDLAAGRSVRRLALRADPASGLERAVALAVRPDGTQVFAVTSGGVLVVLDLASGAEIERPPTVVRCGRAVTVTADGHLLVVARSDGQLAVLRLGAAGPVGLPAGLAGHDEEVMALVAASEQRVVSASLDGLLKVWQPAAADSGRPVIRKRTVVALTAGGPAPLVLSATIDFGVAVDEAVSGKGVAWLGGVHTGLIRQTVVTPGGEYGLTASDDRTLALWRLSDGALLHQLRGHTEAVVGCAVTPDARRAVSVGSDGALYCWDLDSGTVLAGPLALPPPFTGWVNPLVITPGGQSAVYTPDDSVPLVIDLERGVVLTRFSAHSRPVLSLAVTPDGRAALSSSRDETILWELATGAVLAGPWYGWRLYGLAITPDGTRFVAGTWEGTIVIAQLADGAVLARFTGESPVTYCAVADDGRTILAAERSGRVHWLRLEEPERG